jgi:S-adenosylmethionine:tRNA ribosyltransferase-isomerase
MERGDFMKPAAWPRDEPLDERLLVVDAAKKSLYDAHVRDLATVLSPGDLVVVNDAATLPASFAAKTPDGADVEIRLLANVDDTTWRAVLFGSGDWHFRTEDRPRPPVLRTGESLDFGAPLRATVTHVFATSPRLLTIRFDAQGAALWSALYALGRPVQYSHLAGPLELWHVQTPYASRPWSVEEPSAGRPLAWRVLDALRARGVEIATLTHAAGLSSTGDPAIDRMLPVPERYEIPQATVDAVARTRARGGRVVAVGTTVARALEGCAARHRGALVAETATTDLRIDARLKRRVVDALYTGLHEPGASHFDLLGALVDVETATRAYEHAATNGYVNHEFGDSCLIVGERVATEAPTRSRRAPLPAMAPSTSS